MTKRRFGTILIIGAWLGLILLIAWPRPQASKLAASAEMPEPPKATQQAKLAAVRLPPPPPQKATVQPPTQSQEIMPPAAPTPAVPKTAPPPKAEPKPVPESPEKPAEQRVVAPKPSEAPEPKPEQPAPPPADQAMAASPKDKAIGQALLRLAQKGKGPAIRIAWPEPIEERKKVFSFLRRCHGLRYALIDGRGQIAAQEDSSTAFSPMARLVEGRLLAEERQILAGLARTNGQKPVRLLPRDVDAAFLGQAFRHFDLDAQGGSARLAYRTAGNQVQLVDKKDQKTLTLACYQS